MPSTGPNQDKNSVLLRSDGITDNVYGLDHPPSRCFTMRFFSPRSLALTLLTASICALSTVSITVPAHAGGSAPSAPSAASAQSSGPRMRVGTYNFEAFKPMKVFVPAMKKFKRHVDVAGLQEMGQTARAKWLLKDHSWGYYRPPALQQNPIIWRRSVFDFVSAKGIKIANARSLGNEHGGGSEFKKNTYATVVHLKNVNSGQQISFINVHLVHGAIKRVSPYPGRPRTYHLYLDQVAGLKAAVKAEKANSANNGGVYVSGDFNISYRPDAKTKHRRLPYATMHRVGMHSMWASSWELSHNRGTRGTALYDQVWNPNRPVVTKILRRINGSDHKPAVATYALPSAAAGYVPESGVTGFVQQPVQGAEYYKKAFMKFPITGTFDVGWVSVQQVAEDGSDVAQLGTDFVIDDSTLQPGSSFILVRALADGNLHETPQEHFTLQLVPYGGATIPSGQTTVEGYIDDSNRK